jgi:L-amino acid N-acyltransferase YncA
MIKNKKIAHEGAIFVLEKFRDMGMGKNLFKAMVEILKKKNIKKLSVEVWKSNKLSIDVHKKLGFMIVGNGSNPNLYRMEAGI